MIYLILTAVLCLVIYCKSFWSLSYWKDRSVVHKQPWPIFGNSIQLLLQKISFFDYICQLHLEFSKERYFGTYQFIKPILIINDLDLIKRITVKDYEHFIDHDNVISEEAEPLMARSLFNLKGQGWRNMRATLSPSFTSSKMKMMFALISECAEEFTNYFEKQNNKILDVELKDAFSRFTNDAIATTAFGFKCNSLEERENKFYVMGKRLTSLSGVRFVAFIVYIIFPRLAKMLKLNLIPKSVTAFFRLVINDALTLRKKTGFTRPDMIHLLLEAQKGTLTGENDDISDMPTQKKVQIHKAILTDEDITAQAFIFFFGGFDTSSTLLSFSAYELAMNTDIQTKLQEEIDETLKECNGKLNYDAVHKMKYMDMVMSETLRKWPPMFVMDRLCVKDYFIEPINPWEKSFLIEKGTVIQIPIVGIHRNPKHFPNPYTFDPERFNDVNKHSMEQCSYIPFGSGPRSCIASRFALMENKTLLFHLLSKFDIVKTSKTPYPLKIAPNSINVGPAEDLWLGLKRRTHNTK